MEQQLLPSLCIDLCGAVQENDITGLHNLELKNGIPINRGNGKAYQN
jgi:hypothetical protein